MSVLQFVVAGTLCVRNRHAFNLFLRPGLTRSSRSKPIPNDFDFFWFLQGAPSPYSDGSRAEIFLLLLEHSVGPITHARMICDEGLAMRAPLCR
jgi:hypothetical protein